MEWDGLANLWAQEVAGPSIGIPARGERLRDNDGRAGNRARVTLAQPEVAGLLRRQDDDVLAPHAPSITGLSAPAAAPGRTPRPRRSGPGRSTRAGCTRPPPRRSRA